MALFGHFGTSNFGNESTLQAVLQHVRRSVPEADIFGICTAPDVVKHDYGIPAVPISGQVVKPWNTTNLIARIARRLFIGIPAELYRWFDCVAILRKTDVLTVVGTGLLTDAFGIHSWGPYNTFKWSVAAKLSGCRLVFASVGAGPLTRWSGRSFARWSLALADFRSYRDEATRAYLQSIGIHAAADHVFPDLAFSLKFSAQARRPPQHPVVGVGLMLFEGMYGLEKTTRAQYDAYFETLLGLTEWLLGRGYDIRLLIGDTMDAPTAARFRSTLVTRLSPGEAVRVVANPITTAEELLLEIAATDFVVGTRFHNVLLSLFLNKPSIAISFHHKCSSLMDGMGLSEYCHDIKTLDRRRLIENFRELVENAPHLRELLQRTGSQYRTALERQYELILGKAPIHHRDTPNSRATSAPAADSSPYATERKYVSHDPGR